MMLKFGNTSNIIFSYQYNVRMKGSRRTEPPGRKHTTDSWKKSPAGRTPNRIAETTKGDDTTIKKVSSHTQHRIKLIVFVPVIFVDKFNAN